MCKMPREWKTPEESPLNQLSKVRMSTQRLNEGSRKHGGNRSSAPDPPFTSQRDS